MSRPLLPPRGLFTGTRWLFDPALSAPIKETLLQIMALSWGSPGHTTPALSYPQLEAVTGKPARTLRGHLLALRSYHAALRLQRAGAGQFIVALADWLFTNTAPQRETAGDDPGDFLPEPVNDQQEEQEESISIGDKNLLPPLYDHGAAAESQPAEPQGSSPKPLARAMEKRLRAAGVFPALLPEVARRAAQWGYSSTELNRLLDWCADEQPDRPAGLFVARLRQGARAPALYAKPACPQCGQRGKHAQECTRRYLEGF